MTYGVKELKERYGVGEHTILVWIKRGELKAVNVSRTPGGRPKWRCTQGQVDSFEALRTSTPVVPTTRRRRKQASDVIEFIK